MHARRGSAFAANNAMRMPVITHASAFSTDFAALSPC
jgi:hypothetical protein